MHRLKGYGPLLTVAFVGLLLLIFSEALTKWFAANRAAHNGAIIGKITHVEGSVRRIHGADIEIIPIITSGKVDLRDGDRLQTSVQSKADVILNSQDEVEVPAGSAVQFQLWNNADTSSPIYMTISMGKLNSQRTGVKGKAYVVKDGRLYSPAQKPLQKAMALTVLHSAPLDLHLTTSQNQPSDFPANDSADLKAEESAAPPIGLEPDTLSNEYIDEMIVAHQVQLQKCWLSRLKDSPGLKGQIVVQFEISKRGKVKEARVADSTLDDETLKNCVVSVIERVPFRSFKGAEISLSYPINFE